MTEASLSSQEYLPAGIGDGKSSSQDKLRTIDGREFNEVSSPQDLLMGIQSFLFNDSENPSNFTNTFQFWDMLPKYASDHLNSATDVPNGVEIRFTYHGENLVLKQSPGTYERRGKVSEGVDRWCSRYPAHREKIVEMALLKIAAEDGGIYSTEGGGNDKSPYGVRFSIRTVRKIAREMGHTMSHRQVVEAIDVLTSSVIEISNLSGKGKSKGTILSNYACINATGQADTSPDSQWVVFFNPLVANAINTATYRQINFRHFTNLKSFGINIVERLFNLAMNISPDHPHRVLFTELQASTSGLNYSRPRDGIAYLEKEIQKLVDRGLLHGYEKEVIKGRSGSNRGRLAIIDAAFTLKPSEDLVKECKRASRRQSLVEQRINLTPRLRSERRKASEQLKLIV